MAMPSKGVIFTTALIVIGTNVVLRVIGSFVPLPKIITG